MQPTSFIITGSKVIWGEPVTGGKAQLRQGNLGEDANASTVLAENIESPGIMLVDEQAVYWEVTNSGKGIFKLTLASKTVETLVPDAQPNGMVLQGTYLYWNGSPDNFLKRVPLAGGSSESVAPIFWGGPLAADDANIYWADGSLGSVLKWAIAGGKPTTTTLWSRSNHEWPDLIVVTGGHLYFYSDDPCGTIVRMNPDGTGSAPWAEVGEKPTAVAFDDKFGYAVTPREIFRFDR